MNNVVEGEPNMFGGTVKILFFPYLFGFGTTYILTHNDFFSLFVGLVSFASFFLLVMVGALVSMYLDEVNEND